MKLQTGELSELIEKYKKEASNAAQERDDAKKAYDAHVSLDRYTEYFSFSLWGSLTASSMGEEGGYLRT